MAEAAIGLALMSLTWILVAFATFLATNHLRTNMASRDAAWYQGETAGGLLSQDQINDWFFFQKLARVDCETGAGFVQAFAKVSGPYRANVSFGASSLEDPNAATFPYVLLKTRLPFMPATAPDSGRIPTLGSTCQWDGVGEVWDSPGDLLLHILGVPEIPKFP